MEAQNPVSPGEATTTSVSEAATVSNANGEETGHQETSQAPAPIPIPVKVAVAGSHKDEPAESLEANNPDEQNEETMTNAESDKKDRIKKFYTVSETKEVKRTKHISRTGDSSDYSSINPWDSTPTPPYQPGPSKTQILRSSPAENFKERVIDTSRSIPQQSADSKLSKLQSSVQTPRGYVTAEVFDAMQKSYEAEIASLRGSQDGPSTDDGETKEMLVRRLIVQENELKEAKSLNTTLIEQVESALQQKEDFVSKTVQLGDMNRSLQDKYRNSRALIKKYEHDLNLVRVNQGDAFNQLQHTQREHSQLMREYEILRNSFRKKEQQLQVVANENADLNLRIETLETDKRMLEYQLHKLQRSPRRFSQSSDDGHPRIPSLPKAPTLLPTGTDHRFPEVYSPGNQPYPTTTVLPQGQNVRVVSSAPTVPTDTTETVSPEIGFSTTGGDNVDRSVKPSRAEIDEVSGMQSTLPVSTSIPRKTSASEGTGVHVDSSLDEGEEATLGASPSYVYTPSRSTLKQWQMPYIGLHDTSPRPARSRGIRFSPDLHGTVPRIKRPSSAYDFLPRRGPVIVDLDYTNSPRHPGGYSRTVTTEHIANSDLNICRVRHVPPRLRDISTPVLGSYRPELVRTTYDREMEERLDLMTEQKRRLERELNSRDTPYLFRSLNRHQKETRQAIEDLSRKIRQLERKLSRQRQHVPSFSRFY